ERSNAELERFTYTVSHDLKSPLITIKGFLGVLEEDALAGDLDRMKKDMERIANAADKMQQLLEDLLELSRIGRIVNPPEDVPLVDVARDVVEMLSGPIAEKRARVDVDPALPVVHGDRLRLQEVLQNLIENALKFQRPDSDVVVEVGARRDGDETVCFVRDNGIGVNPRYHDKIFGLFEQLENRSAGTGIGLALVKRIVQVHGGRIWVESDGVIGSTFCFTLPRAGA
ncbi:MAG TPA: ATP-binding protein, partial [Polyangiaceae bacterium]